MSVMTFACLAESTGPFPVIAILSKIPPGATALGGNQTQALQGVTSQPTNINAVVNDVLNSSARRIRNSDLLVSKDGRAGGCDRDAERVAPGDRVKLELCEFDRFAK